MLSLNALKVIPVLDWERSNLSWDNIIMIIIIIIIIIIALTMIIIIIFIAFIYINICIIRRRKCLNAIGVSRTSAWGHHDITSCAAPGKLILANKAH